MTTEDAVATAEAVATPEVEAVATPEAEAVATPEVEAVATPEVEAVATPEAEAVATPEAEAVATPEVEAVATPEAEAVATPEAEAVATSEAESVVAAVTEETATVATAVTGETSAESGASFTPVAEDGSRPRKLKDLRAGMELEGRVTSIALYGIFVDIGVGRDGLVHISEMSDTRIDTPSDLVQIGDTVNVRIKSVDPEARRISLTMRTGSGERERSPEVVRGAPRNANRPRRAEVDKERLASLKIGDVVEGVITGYAPFGAFADIGVGKDGLVHVSELAEGRVEKPEDAVKVGDRFAFKILEVDPDGTRISLSLRRAQRSQKMQQLEPNQILEGVVSGIAPFGAFVDIGVGRDGLVHISALSSNRVNRVEDVVSVGDKVSVRVLEVDQQSKRISLTMRLDESDDEVMAEGDEEGYTSATSSAGAPSRGAASSANAPAAARFASSAAEAKAGRERERERRERRERERERRNAVQPETYSTEDVEEEFVGDATLEDLLSKFGGSVPPRRERKTNKREEQDFEDDPEERQDRQDRRQRDAIKRTLQQVGRDD
ncbi:RNA-binding protein [Candidatus Chloroploca asiatica]|uniref:RNA-binding protein n=1 Tax=Candidatus Chloroploca asiatica TaxID=1506545 RepID=A0A2H3KN22_9CHLR|nr:RNA-binding protein [Candidatus Chloroploca asiatica]